MIAPRVSAWIEERHNFASRGIDAGQVGTLVQVAPATCERQVRLGGPPSVLPRNNVLDPEPEERLVFLMRVAVPAPVVSAFADQIA